MRNLTELLEPRPDDADAPAVHFGEKTTSRADLRASAEALGALLRTAGVRPGQAVAVMLPNGPELVAALFGVWSAEAVYLPLNPRLADAEVARLLETARPAAVVTDEASAGRFPGRPVVTAAAEGWSKDASGTVTETHVHGSGIALIQSTSGTTGRPKSIPLRHDTVLELLEPVLRNLLGSRSDDKSPKRRAAMPNLIPTSLSLWAGIYNVLFAFRVGAPVVLMSRFRPDDFAAAVKRFGIRSTVLPPAAMVMLCDDRSVTSLEPLRFVRSITAPLSPLQARRFRERFGVTVLNCYGQTELGGEIVGWNAADARTHGEAKLGAVGRANPGVRLRIADEAGAVVATDAQGEVQVRTPVLSAAATDDSLRERVTDDGWFRTGDIGRLDADGFLWIDGRVSDMINRGGLKVFPAEVEEVLLLSPDIAECAVVGVADDRLGEVPWAFVVPRSGGGVTEAELVALCRDHLAPYKVPVRFRELSALPRNEIGKVLSPRLAALARSADATP